MDKPEMDIKKDESCLPRCVMTRRQLLLSGGIATVALFLTGIPGLGAAKAEAVMAGYPRQKIGSLKALRNDTPVEFAYPSADIKNILVKLDTPAGGGVGPDRDVVAFNPVCTHMGGPLDKAYKAEYKILGQCPFHQSTFDLTRHGMIISGHATESLPQIMLETEGDDIYATAVIGLVYGRSSNI